MLLDAWNLQSSEAKGSTKGIREYTSSLGSKFDWSGGDLSTDRCLMPAAALPSMLMLELIKQWAEYDPRV